MPFEKGNKMSTGRKCKAVEDSTVKELDRLIKDYGLPFAESIFKSSGDKALKLKLFLALLNKRVADQHSNDLTTGGKSFNPFTKEELKRILGK